MRVMVAGRGGCTGRIRAALIQRGHEVVWIVKFIDLRGDRRAQACLFDRHRRPVIDLCFSGFDAAFLGDGLEGNITAVQVMEELRKSGVRTCAMAVSPRQNQVLLSRGALIACARGFVVGELDRRILPVLSARPKWQS